MQTISRYSIREVLGQSWLATVYRASDPLIDREVAIKVFGPEPARDPAFLQRFKDEVRVIAGLEHAYIVPIYEYGDEAGQPYLVMRYMPGGTLRQRMSGKLLSAQETLQIVERLSQALQSAHDRGRLHYGLRPENVLFDSQGEAYLSDFGLARLMYGAIAPQPTQVMGPPEFMSPEQGLGDAPMDARSEVYSLGALTYYMLTGAEPFTAETPTRVIFKHAYQPLAPLDHEALRLPARVNEVLAKGLAKQPADRYGSVREFAAALQGALMPSPSPVAVGAAEAPASATPARQGSGGGQPRLSPAGTGELSSLQAALVAVRRAASRIGQRWWSVLGLVALGLVALLALVYLTGTRVSVEPTSTVNAAVAPAGTATAIQPQVSSTPSLVMTLQTTTSQPEGTATNPQMPSTPVRTGTQATPGGINQSEPV